MAEDTRLNTNNATNYASVQFNRLRYLRNLTIRVAGLYTQPELVEVGAYPGSFAAFVSNDPISLDAIDIVADGIPTGNKKYYRKLFKKDLESALPQELKGAYDVVLSFAVIEHLVIDPLCYLNNCRSLLKPGGRLIIQTPNKSYFVHRIKAALGMTIDETPLSAFLTRRNEGFYGHVLLYNLHELHQMLEYAGFSVENSCYFNSYNGSSLVKRLFVRLLAMRSSWRNQIVVVARRLDRSESPLAF